MKLILFEVGVRILVKVMYEEGSAQVCVQEKEECHYICNSCIRFIWMIPMKDAKWSVKLCFLSVMLMLNPIRNLSQQLIKVLEGLRFLTEHWRVVLACFCIENHGFISSKIWYCISSNKHWISIKCRTIDTYTKISTTFY